MRRLSAFCLLMLLVVAVPGLAQNQPQHGPLVVFVEEAKTLAMASATDSGPDGLTRLADLFHSLGARTSAVRLRDPLPADTKVVVLVAPHRPLPPDFLARIWEIVGAGNSLLVAFDPQGYQGTRTETPGVGLDKLLSLDEGTSLGSGILLEPWFDNKSLNEPFSTFSFGFADDTSNAIGDPVKRYDLPVALWGARPLKVDPLGVDSAAWSIADALPGYVDTATDIFPGRTTPGAPLAFDLGRDSQGIVSVAAMGENTRSGSRVALIGDSEFVENGYGLARSPDHDTPAFPANDLITARLAAWLLRLPDSQYPALPSGMTWIALDGSADDWPANAPVTSDDPKDASILSLNIEQVRAIQNDSYLYVSISTVAQPSADAQVDLELDSKGTRKPDTTVSMRPGQVFVQQGQQAAALVPDADMAIGDVIELRLPLRLTGQPPHVISLCLSSARTLAFPQPPDCLETPIQIRRVYEADPAPLRDSIDPVVAIRGDQKNRINLRSAPNNNASVMTTVPYGTVVAAVGRTSSGRWIQVQNATYQGWVSREVLFTPDSLDSLPVTG